MLVTFQSLTNTSHVQSLITDARLSASITFPTGHYLRNTTAWSDTGEDMSLRCRVKLLWTWTCLLQTTSPSLVPHIESHFEIRLSLSAVWSCNLSGGDETQRKRKLQVKFLIISVMNLYFCVAPLTKSSCYLPVFRQCIFHIASLSATPKLEVANSTWSSCVGKKLKHDE